jgi:L-aspartate oxidase
VTSRLLADYLIIGSGIAGLRAAAELVRYGRVLVLTKSDPGAGSTGYAQGGIAAASAAEDSPELHASDTRAAGDGLCDPAAVEVLVSEGPRYVRELIDWGAAFDRRPDGALDLAQEGAHSVRRVLHARDATGREIARVLAARLQRESAITVVDYATAVQAIVDDGVVAGVRFLDRDGHLVEARAGATLLATGGAGQIYQDTTNPSVATGDGVALAYRAGARVADLEFVQFHPTVLAVAGAPRYLLSEALRGEGARLVNADGQPFVERYDPRGDLASRDRVSQAIVLEMRRTGLPVYLTMAHLTAPVVRERFPVIAELCARVGLDLARDRLPVGPAAHYMMGGVATDLDGRTSLPGLFAAGEVACTGVHGANRLASNSLLEGLVFGGRAGRAMVGWQQRGWPAADEAAIEEPAPSGQPMSSAADESFIRREMWERAGVYRDGEGLRAADATFARLLEPIEAAFASGASLTTDVWRSVSLLTVSQLVVRAALRREESRGAHSRTDHPNRDDVHWNRRCSEARRIRG